MKHWMMSMVAVAAFGLSSTPAWAGGDLALVQSWYQLYLGRSGELCELNGWARQLCAGVPACSVQAGILGSAEYYHRHGCTSQGFVAGLYADVLGRQACAQEIEGWVCRLGPCGGREQLARAFLQASQKEIALRAVQARAVYQRSYWAPDYR